MLWQRLSALFDEFAELPREQREARLATLQPPELAERLARHHHEHHDLSVSTLLSYIDHDHCLASSILRGPTRQVRQLAERIMAESGVRHGQLNQVSLTEDDHEHQHVGHDHSTRHRHLRPLS